jgi:hypothetical protein
MYTDDEYGDEGTKWHGFFILLVLKKNNLNFRE